MKFRIVIISTMLLFGGLCLNLAIAELLKPYNLEGGIEISHITYKEPEVMKDEGIMYGIAGSATYHNTNNFMSEVEGRFSYGEVDYENSGTLDDIDDYILELRLAGGYDFLVSPTFAITPYVGFGYRYLNDDSEGMTSSTGALGYERESNYYYSPIGIKIITDLQNDWNIEGRIEYDYFWRGEQKSHLSGAIPEYNDLENDQEKGYGLRGSITFQRKGARVGMVIEPFIRYWNIKESEIANITY